VYVKQGVGWKIASIHTNIYGVYMDKKIVASASTIVDAPISKVWQALIDPRSIKQYMFGTDVDTDWRAGSPIFWRGEWQGKPYEDKGKILQIEPEHRLQYSHFSPLSGVPDKPENYHTVTVELTRDGNRTRISLAQDNNSSEKERDDSAKNWEMMLASLKKYVEE
jgi:uncharacterized protein YndB with AHSA1/START domain